MTTSSPCTSCGGGEVNYGTQTYDAQNYQATPVYSNTMETSPPVQVQPAQPVQPVALPEATEGSVVVPSADGANLRRPVVDPSAFVIRGN